MFYYFKKGKNATEIQKIKKICAVYGEGDWLNELKMVL